MTNQKIKQIWQAPNSELLPDFIMGGAMKSGTTTLHQILNLHPDIFIPEGELHFFDIDNILQHSDFNQFQNGNWETQFNDMNFQESWKWYQNKFNGKEKFLKGEDSTTFLASQIAARRISQQNKNIKLIFMLRQPSARAYSNYQHLLRSGRTYLSFEKMLEKNPYTVLGRGLYKEQLEVYYKLFPHKNIKIVLFEDFIKNPKETIKNISHFLEVDFNKWKEDDLYLHAHKGSYPKNLKLHLYRNWLFRNMGAAYVEKDLPNNKIQNKSKKHLIKKIFDKFYYKINPMMEEIPKMKKETKEFLDNFYFAQLQGIDEQTELKILNKWFPAK